MNKQENKLVFPKKRNRNELMQFFSEKKRFTVVKRGLAREINEALFPSQKDILRVLSYLPDHRFAKESTKLSVEATKLSNLLNCKRLNTKRSLERLQKDLTLALEARLKNELQVNGERFDWLMATFRMIFEKIYVYHLQEQLAKKEAKQLARKTACV